MRRKLAKTVPLLGLYAMAMRAEANSEGGEASVPHDARGVLRGTNRRPRYSPDTTIASHLARRRLEDEVAEETDDEEEEEDENDNNDGEEEEEEGGYGDDKYYELADDDAAHDDAWYEDEDATQQTNSTVQTMVTKILTWESIAVVNLKTWESSANSTIYKYYETSMNEWTNSQWDLLRDFLFWIVLATCLGVTCCDRCCCTESEPDDVEEENDAKIESLASLPSMREPRSPLGSLASIRSRSQSPPPRRRRRSRKDRRRRGRRNQSARGDGDDGYVLYGHADDDASTMATEMT